MRPEYSFQTSFTVTVVRGSGFRPLLRPGSSCLGLGARMQAVMVLASQDFDSGWFGGFSSQPWESPHRTPTRAFLLQCLGPLVPQGLLLAGRCSACREHAGHCTAGTVAPPPPVPRRRGAGSCTSPARPLVAKTRRASAPCRWAPPQLWGQGRLPYWSPLLSSS